jgi:Zn-finger nucleic acid-binding protein
MDLKKMKIGESTSVVANDARKLVIDGIINGIKNSYGDKYSDRDYEEFRKQAQNAKNKKAMIQLVENLFDLDTMDARDMCS